MRDIVVVGPCGSGKSTLVEALTAQGYAARAVAQEHSAIARLWRHAGEPAALIMLEAEANTITKRRHSEFPDWLLGKQRQRLADARAHADLLITTDQSSPGEVVARVLDYLRTAGISPSPPPAR